MNEEIQKEEGSTNKRKLLEEEPLGVQNEPEDEDKIGSKDESGMAAV